MSKDKELKISFESVETTLASMGDPVSAYELIPIAIQIMTIVIGVYYGSCPSCIASEFRITIAYNLLNRKPLLANIAETDFVKMDEVESYHQVPEKKRR